MGNRRFIKPDAVSLQLELPTNRTARAHNRQVEEKISGAKIRRKPGRPKKLVPVAIAISHYARPKLGKKEVLHLTLKLRRGLPSLRRQKAFKAIERSFFKYSRGDGFRLTQFSVQNDHLHFIAEADSKPALSRAMQKLGISLVKRLAALWGVAGSLYKERYHSRGLKSPMEVRRALLYVIQNGKKHGEVTGHERDGYSSAPYFDGFKGVAQKLDPGRLVAEPLNWLLTTGWRKLGLIRMSEVPAT